MHNSCSKEKKINKKNRLGIGQLWWLVYYEYAITKRSDIYTKTAKFGKKCAAPKFQVEKRCEIKVGGQEIAVIIVQWQKF